MKSSTPSVSAYRSTSKFASLSKRNCIGLSLLLTSTLAIVASAFSPNAIALEFECELPDNTRYIRIDMPGEEHLCEVSVTYANTGVRDVKWYANNDSLFCSAKAYELREKYENLWDYTCTTWPDRDGIDKLSQAQRSILDQRLKALRAQGLESNPPFSITAIRAVASTPLDKETGKLALQFFTKDGDFTEIIDDKVESWQVATTINRLTDQIESEPPVSSALIHAISEEGNLEVYTQLSNGSVDDCFGSQILTTTGNNGLVEARTPHLFVCQDYDQRRNAMDVAAPAIDESLLSR